MKFLEALATPLIAIAVIFVCAMVIVGIAAAVWGDIEVRTGLGKASLRVGRREQPAAIESASPAVSLLPSGSTAANDGASDTYEAQMQPPSEESDAENEAVIDAGGADEAKAYGQYFRAKSLEEIDASFEAIRSSIPPESLEFWQTDHLERREAAGADRGRDAMRALAAANPGWAMPYSTMIDWALADHDLGEARAQLAAGLSKTTSPQFGFLLSSGTKLIYRNDGRLAAFAFACEWSTADLPERIKATALQTLADLLKEDGYEEGYRVALELELAVHPSAQPRIFAAGFSYSSAFSHWAPAVWRYGQVAGPKGDIAAQNNLAILLASMDKAVGVQAYETAMSGGEKYASANLAHMLVKDGYLAIAERLLDSVDDHGSAAENHISARAALLAAQRARDEKNTQIKAVAKHDVDQYRAVLTAGLRAQQQRIDRAPGAFASADREALALVTEAGAFCRVRLGLTEHEGVLRDQTTCYAGWLVAKGQSILGGTVFEFTLIQVAADRLDLIQWPSSIGVEQKIKTIELTRVVEMPALAEPPVQPALGAGLLRGLALPSAGAT